MLPIEQHEIDNLKYLVETIYQVQPIYRPACEQAFGTIKKLQNQFDAVFEFNHQSMEDGLDDAYLNEQYEQEEPW